MHQLCLRLARPKASLCHAASSRPWGDTILIYFNLFFGQTQTEESLNLSLLKSFHQKLFIVVVAAAVSRLLSLPSANQVIVCTLHLCGRPGGDVIVAVVRVVCSRNVDITFSKTFLYSWLASPLTHLTFVFPKSEPRTGAGSPVRGIARSRDRPFAG